MTLTSVVSSYRIKWLRIKYVIEMERDWMEGVRISFYDINRWQWCGCARQLDNTHN